MERTVKFHQDQQVTQGDLNNIGGFARTSLDHAVNDGIEPGAKFWGFPVTETSPLEVTVGEGRYYNTGEIFYRNDDGGVVLSLASLVPVVTSKIVTVAVWGSEDDTNIQPRTFLVDTETLQTEAEAVATESRRFAQVNLVGGTEAAAPVAPALAANVIAVAYITMDPGGIVSIERATSNEIVSASANAADIAAIKLWQAAAGKRLDTLASDLVSLASKINNVVYRSDFFEVTADVARLKESAGLPEDLVDYAYDHFITREDSDDTHVDWLARIEEGIRFPAAQSSLAQMALLNQFEDRVTVHPDGLMLPKYNEVARISVTGNDGEVSISQYPQDTVEMVQKTRVTERLRRGSSFKKCTNSAFFRSGYIDAVTGLFIRDGETYEIVPVTDRGRGGERTGQIKWYRFTRVWIDRIEENYWEQEVIEDAVTGATVAQTFLMSQAGWLTSINLFFTKAAAAGDVHVLITETSGGKPDINKVIARVQLDVEDILLYPEKTAVPIGPVQLDAGRYGLVLITSGAHFVSIVNNNKFAEGSFFYTTDGEWFMGDTVKDLTFELMFAEFINPRIEVQMQPLTLENGIANIDIMAEAVRPNGMDIFYEIQVNSVWRRLDDDNDDLLVGLPALLPFRLTFVGTTDNHCGVALGAPSTVLCWRPRADFTHISATRELLSPTDTVEVRLQLEWFDDAHHAVTCQLVTDGSPDWTVEIEPDVVETIALPPKAGVDQRYEKRYTFNTISPAVDAYKIRIGGTTDNVLITYHVAERVDISF